jgi:hypothetical protein
VQDAVLQTGVDVLGVDGIAELNGPGEAPTGPVPAQDGYVLLVLDLRQGHLAPDGQGGAQRLHLQGIRPHARQQDGHVIAIRQLIDVHRRRHAQRGEPVEGPHEGLVEQPVDGLTQGHERRIEGIPQHQLARHRPHLLS